jgi:hypothetical protein
VPKRVIFTDPSVNLRTSSSCPFVHDSGHISFAADETELFSPPEALETIVDDFSVSELDVVSGTDFGLEESLRVPRLGTLVLVGVVIAFRIGTRSDGEHTTLQRSALSDDLDVSRE